MIRTRFLVILATVCLILGLALFRHVGLYSTPSANEAKSKIERDIIRMENASSVDDCEASVFFRDDGREAPDRNALLSAFLAGRLPLRIV